MNDALERLKISKIHKAHKNFQTIIFVLALCFPWLSLCNLHSIGYKHLSFLAFIEVLFIAVGIGHPFGLGCTKYRKLIQKLAILNNIDDITVILEATVFPFVLQTEEVVNYLTLTLNKLTEDDYGILTSFHQKRLCGLVRERLGDNSQQRLSLAALNALSNVGNRDSFLFMLEIARRNYTNNAQQYITDKAQSFLNNMEQRLQRQNQPETLLRPSVSFTSSDVLLRPASGAEQITPDVTEQLLRSTTTEASRASNMDAFSLPALDFTTSQHSVQQVQLGQQADEDTS